MRKIKIVADSSSDILSLKYAEFSSAPLRICSDEREFTDNSELDVRKMTEYFDKYKGKSSTACPGVGDWIASFGDADDVICVTITSGLSGSYNSACAAKEIYEQEHKGRRVFVADSLSAGPEVSLIVYKLEDYIKRGMSYEDICQKITEYRETTGLLFMLKSLGNFANNGRVSPATAKLAGIMGICVVGRASNEGTLEPIHKCRGEGKSLSAILAELEDSSFDRGRVLISHNDNPVAALRLKKMICDKHPEAKVLVHSLRGLCSYYAEKGGVLVGYEKK